ncbi:MAG TPA: hypothetical protein PK370_01775, partial [Candidatus Woesebacteria bacterium]|nr:hypothetical protein [Candidatus Woesebacteria bacterium]
YERFYANSQSYPWMVYGPVNNKPSVEDAVLLRSDTVGFGVCDSSADLTVVASTTAGGCTTNSTTPGLLISKDELKTAFVGKDEFRTVGANDENGLYLFKDSGSGGSIYVCYVPKAKSNRDAATNQLWCLTDTPTRVAAGQPNCAAPASTGADDWGDPTAAIDSGEIAIFKCVP